MSQVIVFSGFQNEMLKAEIEEAGGKVATTVTAKTTMVIIKDRDAKDTKIVNTAKSLGIPIDELSYYKVKSNIKLHEFYDCAEFIAHKNSKSQKSFVPSLKQLKAKFGPLGHGDLIDFNEYSIFHDCFIVYKVDNVEKLLRNKNKNDGLLIPIQVSEHMVNPWQQYGRFYENFSYALNIELASNSWLVKNISNLTVTFKKNAVFIAQDAQPQVITQREGDGEVSYNFALSITYKGKEETFAYNINNPPDGKVISDYFKNHAKQAKQNKPVLPESSMHLSPAIAPKSTCSLGS